MTDASRLVDRVRSELQAIDDQIRNHPYPELLERRAVSLDALRAFPGHQYHIITSDMRSLAILVQRFGGEPSHDFFMGILQGEHQGLPRLLRLAARLQMTEAELRDYPVTAEGFAYTTFMAYQALYASAAEFVLGILVNFAAWGHNCARTSAALRHAYGFTAEQTEFLDTFAAMPPFEEVALEIIQAGLDRGDDPLRLSRGARLFQAYEKMFWDCVAELAETG
ncbi:MAG: transcriptional regulator [Gemmatimonadota bacterium]|nr:MAG: transcriptional regulator [Gemmatimonadota bacterium]